MIKKYCTVHNLNFNINLKSSTFKAGVIHIQRKLEYIEKLCIKITDVSYILVTLYMFQLKSTLTYCEKIHLNFTEAKLDEISSLGVVFVKTEMSFFIILDSISESKYCVALVRC